MICRSNVKKNERKKKDPSIATALDNDKSALRKIFDLFLVRFLIYIKFSSNLEQSQNSGSMGLEMAQEKQKMLLFENHEKVTFFSLPIFNILLVAKSTQRWYED